MTRFRIDTEKNTFRAMLVLTNLVRKKSFPNTMIGPFEDYVVLSEGIIIDGDKEPQLSRAFGRELKRRRIKFNRTTEEGNYYKVRDW